MSIEELVSRIHYGEQAEHILIVDDDVVCVRTLHAVVKDLGTIAFTTQAVEVMRLAKQLRPRVVLLDISMPERDGYQLCKDLKSCPETQDAAIIFITSNDDVDHELKAFEVGASDFLPKPFNAQLVRARVQVQLALRQEVADSVQTLLGSLLQQAGRDPSPAEASAALVYRATDGSKRHVHASAALRLDAKNAWGALLLLTDVTAVTAAEAALDEERERARVILSSIGDSVIATDARGLITYVNPVAETMTEWEMADALGQPIESIMPLRSHGEEVPLQNPIRIALVQQRKVGMALDTLLVTRSGHRVPVEDSASPIRDVEGNIAGAQARIAAQTAIDLVSTTMTVEGADFHIGCSVGISVYPDDALTREDLMRHADSALYRAKSDGRNRLSFHSAVEVHYQPQIDLSTQTVDTVEALVRLRDEAGQLIAPSEFIAYAEETGLIIPLSRAVLADACKQITEMQALGYRLHVAINVSIVQFAQADFEQSDLLVTMGCNTMQGYFYSKPMPGHALAAWLHGWVGETAP
eukprot:gene10916-10721_t